MLRIKSNNNITYRTSYHVIWCPKYRRSVISEEIGERFKELAFEVCVERGAELFEIETMADHVHLLVDVDPQYGIHRLVKQIKGRSSRILRTEYPELKRKLPTLWTNSYFISTVGEVDFDVVKDYVHNQRNV